LVDVTLKFALISELSSSVVDGSDQQVHLDETVQESASKSIDTLYNILGHTFGTGRQHNSDHEGTNGNNLTDKLIRSLFD
jgi:hypothetical protein